MKAPPSFLRSAAGLIGLGAAVALPAPRASAQDASGGGADAFPTYESYVKVSGEAPWITGDKAAFDSRSGVPSLGSIGIEDLYYTKNLSDSTAVTVDGRALGGTDDYLASLNLSDDDLGSVEVGYKRFRTFYDGVGGFFPLADEFQAMSPEDLHVDRGAFWAEAKLAKPDSPVSLDVSFRDEIRTGDTDSTIWGAIVNPDATVVNGALVGAAPPSNTPETAPDLLSLAEHHDLLSATLTGTFGRTTETLTAAFDWVSNIDTRYYVKYPGSIVVADPTVDVLDDQETVSSHSFRLTSRTETKLSERLALEVGLTYLHDASNDGGVWITPTYSSTAKAVYPAVTAGDIFADAGVDDYVGNLFLTWTPDGNWRAEVGYRQEYSAIGDAGGFIATSLASTATTISPKNISTAFDPTYSHDLDHVGTPEVSVEYHGFSRLSLYGTFDGRITHGDQHWINPYAASTTTGGGVVTAATAPIGNVYLQDADQQYENAKIGADWAASSCVTIRAELFRDDHENRFLGSNDIVGTGSYGALFATGYALNGLNLSVVCRPFPQWTFTTRYQPQEGDMGVTGAAANGGDGTEVTSGTARIQMIGETIDWDPCKQLYAQAGVNLVYDCLQTSYPAVVVTTAAPPVPVPVANANNNYVTGSALVGFVLDKLDDAEIETIWQQATNYNPQIALGGQAYGSTFLFESATVGLKHKFNDHLLGDAKLGYLRSTDGTTGGFTNYRGPLAYVALEYGL